MSAADGLVDAGARPVSRLVAAEPIIQFSHVKKAFGQHVVFDDLTLDIRKGETLTILGASGSGKSVALKLLIRLLECDAGTITFHGRDVTTMSERETSELRQRVGMLFQSGALFDSVSVGENVAYGLRERSLGVRISESEIALRVARALSLVGLPGIEAMLPSELSGGMKKRVGLARAIAVEPEVLLYDEPTTGLDPVNTARIARVISGLQSTLSITSVVVTHDMKTAFALSDRLALLHQGRVLVVGTPDELRRSTDPRVSSFIRGEATEGEDVTALLGA